jgi:hypothetical protein
MATPPISILQAFDDPRIFGPHFAGPTWDPWRVVLAALFGLPLEGEGLEVYRRHSRRQTPPGARVREAWIIAGRRSGKSRIAAMIAVYLAVLGDWWGRLARGERGIVMLIATDRYQAGIVFEYVEALIDSTPMLATMVTSRSADSIDFDNGISVEVHTCSYRSIRGRTAVAAVLDEVAFWRSDESANPDREVLNALRPATATVPGAMIVGISTPYARRGVLWQAFRSHHGPNHEGDPILVWKATTREMNETVPQETIDAAFAEDESAARAEWCAEFRSDVETFIAREVVEACVVPGRFELGPIASGIRHVAFVDPSGGSADSMTLAIAHAEKTTGTGPDAWRVVVDAVRERRPPFSPEDVVEEFAALLRTYGCREVTADRYGGEFCAEPFRRRGITYKPAAKPKSDLYKDCLGVLNSGRVELLDHARLVNQLCALERRTARGGRDSIDHSPGGRDDVANAVAGAIGSVVEVKSRPVWRVAGADPADDPEPRFLPRPRVISYGPLR